MKPLAFFVLLALAASSHDARAVVHEDNLVPSASRIGNA